MLKKDFKVYCSRVQDEMAPYVFINIPSHSIYNKFLDNATSIKIYNPRSNKSCYVQPRTYDENYRKSHNYLCNRDSNSDGCDIDKENKLKNDIEDNYCIFISEYYRKRLGITSTTTRDEKYSIVLEISKGNESFEMFYSFFIALQHPETTFKCMVWLAIIGILTSILLDWHAKVNFFNAFH